MIVLTDDPMSKKRAEPVPTPEPEVIKPNRKPMVVQVRGSEEWKAWAERLANHDGVDMAMLVDRAFRIYAKHTEFPETPPKR